MKKIITLLLFLSIYTVPSFAQEVGVRFSADNDASSNVGIDLVFSTGKFSRIHSDVSFNNNIAIDFLWDFLYQNMSGQFYGYGGVGLFTVLGDPFGLGGVAELGTEYRFEEVPIVLGIDLRPRLTLVEETGLGIGFGFNARWNFGR